METTLEWISNATRPSTPACTFLIPARLLQYLTRRKKQCGGVVKYLKFLLARAPQYRRAGLLPKVERTTRYYQRSGQALDRWHVRVPAHHWTELRCLAGGCGVTMTHMFAILIEIEKSKKFRPDRTATDDPPTLIWKNVGFWEARVEDQLRTERHIVLVLERAPPKRLS
ncbi:MAG: DUF1564 family protein [Spirochaetales bacterium]|nr:DUF1564 family protein [Leptospiraceae bacterium]MCP5480252.1 DUF1564 family protein [Spirochaetales bacterium]MCP5486349.1 DUF1564 family protein [Spirochaetales bacterium]